MTQGPEYPDQPQQPEGEIPPPPAYGQPGPPPYGQAPTPPPYGQQAYPPPPPGPGLPWGASPQAPYGVHPVSGLPYSDKSKLVAGLLQLLIPLGIGRFYIGDTKTGVWQLLVTIFTCGIGGLWPFIDGIILLATDSTDVEGRPLRS